MRNDLCPICAKKSTALLQLHFNRKMSLPTEVKLSHCGPDNFLFVSAGEQASYDEYYTAVANDSYHSEVARGDSRSPIAKLQRDRLVNLLGEFFRDSRRVLDFGCGEGWLLTELAREFSFSKFYGFDPSPAAQFGAERAEALGVSNLFMSRQPGAGTSYDLVIASHVLEHLIDFDLIRTWSSLLSADGLLYIEVPDALRYANHERIEFLYYFDRLHVNHFTPQSLNRLLGKHGFGYAGHFEYEFPYRDGKSYPALGMLFRKGGALVELSSASIMETATDYVCNEQKRAEAFNKELKRFDGVLVWGAGDNFYRSSENCGPLSGLANMVVLDRHPQVVTIGAMNWQTLTPADGIRRYPWPVVITVSAGRKSIADEVKRIDSSRRTLFL